MALKWLRDQFKHLKIVLWGVVAVFVLLVFVDWGTGRSGGGARGDVALTIGSRDVGEQEFLRALKRNHDQFQRLYGDQWEQVRDQLDLAAYTAQQFVRRELLLREAERVGLMVSQEELVDEISADPAFQREGGGFVGRELYHRILRANRMSPQEYEARLAEDLLIRKLTALMENGVIVSDDEVEDSYRRQRETSDFDAILVRYESFLDDAVAAEDAIQAYYEENADRFRRDEQRVLRYLVVETSRLERLLPVEEGEIEQYYQAHRDEFVAGEEVHARHILLRVPGNASEAQLAETELRGQQVAQLARSGADFAELARLHSEDPATKDSGGDLSWFGRGAMVEEFDQAVFGAEPGEILGPVKSRFGYHVIKVEDRRPERQLPLEEIREQVRSRVVEGRAAAEAEARAEALARRVRSERPASDEAWQQIVDEDEAVVLNISPPFSRGQDIPGIGSDPELVEAVFAASVGELDGPRAIPRGWMVWGLKEIHAAGVPTLEEVRSEVAQRVRQALALDQAASAAAETAERWRGGADPGGLAAELDTEVAEIRDHRWGQPVPRVGPAPEVDEAVFAAAAGEVIGPVRVADRMVMVARVESVERVDPEQLEAAREVTRSRLRGERAGRLLDAVMAERQRDTVITVNNELMQRFAPRPQVGSSG